MKNSGLYTLFIVLLTAFCTSATCFGQNPKREFRGAWISTVYQDKYAKRSTEENKKYLRDQLDKLQAAGVNAVLFQARPSADAFYDSKLEPWSRFISPSGIAPKPFWDPLQFMVDEAHARGMELHAWINPYRVTTAKNQNLPKNHLYHKEPWRFVTYDGKIYFDPGLPENRDFITKVIADITDRYDVDGIHFDDYFYPYPVKGMAFPDSLSYAKYGNGKKLADWRRENVDLLIEQINEAIRSGKRPWIRFGISPFGIWRNKSSDSRGSDTGGLQNYDDLYADVLLWAEKGWIDYLLPQLYWEIEHPRASYAKLVEWWANVLPGFPVYIGQDVERTMNKPDIAPGTDTNQLAHKLQMMRSQPGIEGLCWWPAFSLTANYKGVADSLANGAHSTMAIVPAYTKLHKGKPTGVKKAHRTDDQLRWESPKAQGKVTDVAKFVVYCLPEKDESLIDNPEYIVAVTPENNVRLTRHGWYTVTALDRVNNESTPAVWVKF